MLIPERQILNLIEKNIFLKNISETDLARIITAGETVLFEAGKSIFTTQDKADFIYLVLEGEVSLTQNAQKTNKREGDFLGCEGFLKACTYQSNAITNTKVSLYKIHKIIFNKITQQSPDLIKLFCISNLDQSIIIEDTTPPNKEAFSHPLRIIVGWMLAFITPILTYHLLGDALTFPGRFFISIFTSCIALWTFNITYEFVPGLLIIISCLTLGIAPPNIVLSGFTSDTYLLILSLSGVAAVVVSSGILYRIVAIMLHYLPMRSSWHVIGLFSLGALMTPIIPSIINRTRLIANVFNEIIDILKINRNSVLATKFAAAAFAGTSCLSSVFVTGSIMNFTALGLLPLQERLQISSIGWTFAALIPAIIMMLTNLFGLSLFFHTREKIHLTKDVSKVHLEVLGSLKKPEWEAIIATIFFVVALVILPSQQINIAILGLFLFFAVTALGILSIPNWIARTDWAFLLFIGTVIGIANCFSYLKINESINNIMLPLLQSTSNSYIILSFIILATIMIRFIMPIGPTFVVMMSLGTSIADYYGINLWLITFTILLITDTWFFPYQCPFYNSFKQDLTSELPYNEKSLLTYNLLNNAARIIAIFASIPFWKYIGLL